MFIYQFMAGVVETVIGDDNDRDFDPHKKRNIPKPTTYSDTMVHLLKGSIGAGVLAMPEACCRIGIFYGTVGIILIGFFASYCLNLLILAQYQVCKKWKRGYLAYPKSMKLALQDGPKCLRWSARPFYGIVDGMLIVWQIGICAIYFVFVAVNVVQVLEFYDIIINVRMMIAYLLPPMILLNMIKELKLMTPVSSFSNCITLLGMLFVFFYLIEDDVVIDNEKFKVKTLTAFPLFIGTTLFAMEAVGVVLAIEYNMEKPSQFTGVFGLLNIGMTIIIILFALLGVAGYLKYGDEVKASVTLNLPPHDKKAQLAKLLFAVALFLSFPLQNFVAYEILLRKIKKKVKPESFKFYDYALRVLLVLIPFAMAIGAPNLGASISFLGALCLSLLAIVFPALMDLCVWYPDRYGILKYKLMRDVCLIIIGMFCLCSGIYTSILEFAAMNESNDQQGNKTLII